MAQRRAGSNGRFWPDAAILAQAARA